MSTTSKSDERMGTQDIVDSPSLDGANSGENVGLNGPLKKGPWTSAEDAILIDYVSKHGEGNWNAVQKHSGLSRCGKSCRLRWANHLRPNLKKGAFTPEEERRIIELHFKMGNKWARMATELPGRTDNEIKNFWNTRIKRRQRAGLPIYPNYISSQVKIENPQGDDINSYSSGDVTIMPAHNSLQLASVEFKGLELDQPHLYSPTLLDISSGNLHDVPPSSIIAQGIQSSYMDNSLLPTAQPAKRLRGSESVFSGIVNSFNGGNQFESFAFSSAYDHEISSSLLQGSHAALLNGTISSDPIWAMKMELPSLQNSVGSWDPPASPLPIFDDVLIRTPQTEDTCPVSLPNNSGLLDAVLYESEIIKKSNSNGFLQTSDAPNMTANLTDDSTRDLQWGAYDEGFSPLGHSSSSVFSDGPLISGNSFDEPQSVAGLTGSKIKEEPRDGADCDRKINRRNLMMASRPDLLLASNCFGPMKHLNDAVL